MLHGARVGAPTVLNTFAEWRTPGILEQPAAVVVRWGAIDTAVDGRLAWSVWVVQWSGVTHNCVGPGVLAPAAGDASRS